ncbi:hypothetical protein TPHV1_110020 [Treponema phagedenis]|uniref:Uncharacterized protein n=1 Tax=Treponema phagedenis TaxID=162 RepID=A0A0B7GQC1_TREPH|nr:hypothetical protein TPHV1_110020 [Treponema phagedenis]
MFVCNTMNSFQSFLRKTAECLRPSGLNIRKGSRGAGINKRSKDRPICLFDTFRFCVLQERNIAEQLFCTTVF